MQPRLRFILRTSSLTCAMLPFLPFTEWATAMSCVTSASPFIALSAALGGRTISLVTAACLPLVILAFFKHRWFCAHLCPTGFILELSKVRSRNKHVSNARFPHLADWLLFLGIGLAAAGYPLLMAFDPLSILSGFLSTWQRQNLEWRAFMSALPFLGLIALNIVQPNLWCQRLCPLGAAQHFLGTTGRRLLKREPQSSSPGSPAARHREDPPSLQMSYGRTRWSSWLRRVPQSPVACRGVLCEQVAAAGSVPAGGQHESSRRTVVRRRFFLLALSGGIAGLLLARKKSGAALAVIRPPGAVNENVFTGLCARCGNCVNVCPEGIIFPDMGSSGICGLFTPVLNYDHRYCNEWCSKCAAVCPTAAIRHISLEQKRLTAIGTARIDKSKCLAWEAGQNCMVCQEFCPYQAITIVEHGGVNCPEVREELCRGCGACQSQCPAIPQKAITVRGMLSQRAIKAENCPFFARKLP